MKILLFSLLWFTVITVIAILVGLCARQLRGGFWVIPLAILEVAGIYIVCDLGERLVTMPLIERGMDDMMGIVGTIYYIASFAWGIFVVIYTQKFLLRRARKKLGWPPSPKKK